ncbi:MULTISPECIES: signal peptidase I [unclassified Flavobacterium]|uniref:signal peptidase I n=1 Tax=unclassified Flavobacterium TaxID=196869 RepID=UPI001F14806F|nr:MULTISPECIES: signal peptidase I [unclassified Flavobacterium]UMY65569.1 signal peptidase I [Flavobacterium sp. HJ-32-4]
MTTSQWLLFFLLVQVIHFLGTWKLYVKAGRKAWEAAVPVYNAVVLMKIINRSPWWTVLLFVPVINIIMFPVVWVETLRSFGKNSTTDTLLGLFTLGFYIYYINYAVDVKYVENRSLKATSKAGDTLSSLLFAVVVATVVHTYVMQPFTIPTPSLEKTLLVGDYLFVSKFNFGARVPMTAVAAPMVHDTIIGTGLRSYSKWPQYPYFRFPAFESVEKNDIVVFNWPTDTVRYFRDKVTRGLRKPIDKKSNYVKRCVGTPGDTLEIRDGYVYINGKKLILSDRARPQYNHKIYSTAGVMPQQLRDAGITGIGGTYDVQITSDEQGPALEPYILSAVPQPNGVYRITVREGGVPDQVLSRYSITLMPVETKELQCNMTLDEAAQLRKVEGIDSVVKITMPTTNAIFPQVDNRWSIDNYGPIYIPKKGATIPLTLQTLPFYKEIIREYEKHELEVKNGTIYIDGKPATSYTFGDDYYWMMGDNRHNSEDSRYWGYVPSTHIVGKPVFIWWSVDPAQSWKNPIKKIRWDRLFTTVGGHGKPVSYLPYFLITLAIYLIGNTIYKKRKAAKA